MNHEDDDENDLKLCNNKTLNFTTVTPAITRAFNYTMIIKIDQYILEAMHGFNCFIKRYAIIRHTYALNYPTKYHSSALSNNY